MKLSESFLKQYRYQNPKWGFGGLGYVIYLRTYSRKKSDGTLERWDETVERITNGNFDIEEKRLKEIGQWDEHAAKRLTAEMERFYHLVFNLVMTPPGRGLWMSGTEYATRVGDAENNCWGVSMRPQPYEFGDEPKVSFAPVFTFDQAMKGGGVGINIQSKYVSQVPKVLTNVQITFICDENHPDFEKELAQLGVEPKGKAHYFADETILVHDSRQGWAKSLERVIDSHYEPIESICKHLVIDLSDVRERGRAIVGFGGEASGPSPLVSMLNRVNDIINTKHHDFVSPTEWGDVVQNIGVCVVAGNVRRTALILIGDEHDAEYIQSKNYALPENLTASQWRWASNNSVDIGVSTDRETLRNLAVNIYYNGEPGYVNLELSKNFGRIIDGFKRDIDGEVEVFNPCGEITLPNGSPCNLFEVNLPRIQDLINKGIEPASLYEEVFYLATRYAYRITFRPYEWAVTRDVVYRHRRLGVGITGITDWVLMLDDGKAIRKFDDLGNPIYNSTVTGLLDTFYGFVKNTNIEHATELKANPSIKLTTVKPSGTVSLLMGQSPGQHFHWSKYMIRRVRMSANAPLVDALLQCGYNIEPAIQGFDEGGNPLYNYQTVVVDFPVKAPTADHPHFQSAGDVSLPEQAALQSLLATYWSDNAVSATLSFHKGNSDDEHNAIIDEITNILDRYKGVIKSTSLLPHAVGTYPQMPYEEIDETTYHTLVGKLKANVWDVLKGDIQAFDDEVDSSQECVGGSCPIK